jgi:hypothetical protein
MFSQEKYQTVGLLLCLAHSQIVLMIWIGIVFFMQCMFGNKIITWLVNYFYCYMPPRSLLDLACILSFITNDMRLRRALS